MSTKQYLAYSDIRSAQNMCLMYVSTSHYDTDWLSIPHTHPCTELFYCIKGVGQFIIGDQVHPVGSDDLIIINTHVAHTERSYPSNPLEYIVLGIDGADFSFLSDDTPWLSINFAQSKDTILPHFNNLLDELQRRKPQFEQVCRHLMELIFIKIQRQLQFNLKSVASELMNKECMQVKRFLDVHFREPLTLEQLAAYVHINKFYLAHTFQKAYGISPMSYMIDLRIAASKHMLMETDYSISHISQATGFSSPSYFAQSFKKRVSISPNEYRNPNKYPSVVEKSLSTHNSTK